MNNRNLVLGGVASFALAVAMIATTPSSAQSYPGRATPADQAAYEAALAQHNAALAQHSAAQSQYNAQLQDFRRKNSVYQSERERYQDQAADYSGRSDLYQKQASDYGYQLRAYDNTLNDEDVLSYPDEDVLTHPDGRGPLVELDDISDPDREIGGVPVADRAGHVVGHFRHMTYQDGGREEAVINLPNNKTVVVDDEHLRYDPDHDMVVADLSYDELNSMPARF